MCGRLLTTLSTQGKKTDGSVNAYAVNVSMKRKYRCVSKLKKKEKKRENVFRFNSLDDFHGETNVSSVVSPALAA